MLLSSRAHKLQTLCGITPCFHGLFPTQGQITYVLLTRSPLSPQASRLKIPVRLACLRRAASVSSEPGSNSPSYYTSLPHLRREASLLIFCRWTLSPHLVPLLPARTPPHHPFRQRITGTPRAEKALALHVGPPLPARRKAAGTAGSPNPRLQEPKDPLPLPCQRTTPTAAAPRPCGPRSPPVFKDPHPSPPQAPTRTHRPGTPPPPTRGGPGGKGEFTSPTPPCQVPLRDPFWAALLPQRHP